MTPRDFYLLVREMRQKQKRVMLNKSFFESKQFKEMQDSEKEVDKALADFTKQELESLPFKD